MAAATPSIVNNSIISTTPSSVNSSSHNRNNNLDNGNNNNNNNRFDNLINRYRTRGLTAVADFLTTKARRSKRTVLTFSFVIDYLNEFIEKNFNKKYDIQTILPEVKSGQIDVYKLLNNFVSCLQNHTANCSNLSPATLNLYISAAKSYFQFNDIDISPNRFKYRVSLPTVRGEDEKAIDSND